VDHPAGRRRAIEVRRERRARAGAGLVEYILVVGMVALLALLAVRVFGSSTRDKVEAQARCVETLACSGDGQPGAADLPPGHTPASAAAAANPSFADYATAQVEAVIAGVADTTLPLVAARTYRASYRVAEVTVPAEPAPEPPVDLPGAAAAGRRMTEAEASRSAASVFQLANDGRLFPDVFSQLGITQRYSTGYNQGDVATLFANYVTPTLSNPVASFPFGGGATYLGLVDGQFVQVEVDLQGQVTNVLRPDDYTVASYLCGAGRADGCTVRDAMDERARQEMNVAGSVLEAFVGLTPVVGTGLDIRDIVTTCPSSPLSFDCGAAVLAIIPGVPGLGRADEVVDATRAAERVGDAAEGARDLAGTTTRVAGDLTHVRTPYNIGDVKVEMNTGHGFHREHRSGGVATDLRTTNLTSQAIEQRILGDLEANLPAVRAATPGAPMYTGRVVLDGHTIEYRAVNVDGTLRVSSYYLVL
jgi:hypothetical protein